MAQDGCRVHERGFRTLRDIDERLLCSVIWSEDWRFFFHDGVDRSALSAAIEGNLNTLGGGIGGSTITMQLARNLFLSRARTPSRKVSEVLLALALEARLTKKRLLELYINDAEWAPCVYGAEAAAQHYFGHDARTLSLAESSMLASMLPRPSRLPAIHGPRQIALLRHQQRLLRRVWQAGLATRAEFESAQRELLDRGTADWSVPFSTRRDTQRGTLPDQAEPWRLAALCGTNGFHRGK